MTKMREKFEDIKEAIKEGQIILAKNKTKKNVYKTLHRKLMIEYQPYKNWDLNSGTLEG